MEAATTVRVGATGGRGSPPESSWRLHNRLLSSVVRLWTGRNRKPPDDLAFASVPAEAAPEGNKGGATQYLLPYAGIAQESHASQIRKAPNRGMCGLGYDSQDEPDAFMEEQAKVRAAAPRSSTGIGKRAHQSGESTKKQEVLGGKARGQQA